MYINGTGGDDFGGLAGNWGMGTSNSGVGSPLGGYVSGMGGESYGGLADIWGFGEDTKRPHRGRHELPSPSLYQPLIIGSESMPSAAEEAPGQAVAAEAKDLNYQDLYRNIQAMREARDAQERARGAIGPELSGLGMGDMMSNKPLMLAAGAVLAFLAYKKFFAK